MIMLPAKELDVMVMIGKCKKAYVDMDGSNKSYEPGQIGTIVNPYFSADAWDSYHLYLLSNEELSEVDYAEFGGQIIEVFRICTPENTVMFPNPLDGGKYITIAGIERFRRVVATTNPNLGMPAINSEMIKRFVETQGVSFV